MGVSWRPVSSAKISTPSSLRVARTCYDHLAGEIAVHVYDYMISEAWITSDGASMTLSGQEQFRQLGIMLNLKIRRKACCACLEWSERRFHLGGEAGAAFFSYCELKGWLTRTPGFRDVNITASGKRAFERLFSLYK